MQRVSRKSIYIIVFTIILAAILATVYIKFNNSSKDFPKDVRSQISVFQPYYFAPKDKLPDEFTVNKDSIKYEQGTLIFTLSSPSGKTVTLSQQAVPEEFAQDGNLIGKETFDSPNGTVTLSFLEGRTTAFLITKDKDAFVILNSEQAVSSDTIRVILSSLVKI